MKRTNLIVLSGFTGLLLLVVLSFSGSPSGAADEAEPAGKTAFMDHKCAMCHAVPAAGIEAKMKSAAMKGPDLAGGPQALGADDMAKYLRKQMQLNGKDHKKEYKGGDEDVKAILGWLAGLKTE